MEKRGKLISMALCLTLAVGMMSGCNGNTQSSQASDSGTSSAEKPKEKVNISFALWNADAQDFYMDLAEKFEEETNIHVDIQVSDWNTYWTGLEAGATGGSLPDTFWMHSTYFYKYASNDQLLDLTNYISKDSVKMANYPKDLVNLYMLDSKQYAMPKDYDTIALWYNKKMFDEAKLSYPDETWTWDDLYEAAKKLTKADKSQYGFSAGLHAQEGYYNTVFQAGGSIVTDDKKSGYALPETEEGLEYYFRFIKEGLSPEIYANNERVESLENGLCAMGFFGSWRVGRFAKNDYMKANFDCTVLPSSNDGKRATIYNGLGLAAAKNSKNPDAAWAWIKYLTSEEGQKAQAESGIAIPTYMGTSDGWVNKYSNFNAECFTQMLDYGVIYPYTNKTAEWENKATEYLKNAYNGSASVDSVCKEIEKTMNDIIAAE